MFPSPLDAMLAELNDTPGETNSPGSSDTQQADEYATRENDNGVPPSNMTTVPLVPPMIDNNASEHRHTSTSLDLDDRADTVV